MSKPLVGLVGYAQAGKDTFAGYLGFKRFAFADTLKAVAYDTNPHLRAYVDSIGWEEAKKKRGMREFLQDLGIAVREHLGPDTWVDAAFGNYDASVATVFTDVRFPNEIEAIRAAGGIIVRIDRVGHQPVNSHVSEFAWQATTPDEHFVFQDGALHHMELVAISLAGRLK